MYQKEKKSHFLNGNILIQSIMHENWYKMTKCQKELGIRKDAFLPWKLDFCIISAVVEFSESFYFSIL